jgi:hypothetical protein
LIFDHGIIGMIQFVRAETSYRQITEVPEYWFDDIRSDDRVVDIGANVGAFCLRAAQLSSRILAVEPVTTDLLKANIRLNAADVTVVEGALGDGSLQEICWDECRVLSPTYPLQRLIQMAGGCDFLKCDCEGGEWKIRPGDLAGIRRIEMELHTPPICKKINPELLDYIGEHYNFEIVRTPCHDALGVMGLLHAVLLS